MRKYSAAFILLAIVVVVSAAAYARPVHLDGQIVTIDAVAKSLEVGDATVYVTDDTDILICGEPASFEDLAVGQVVRVVADDIDGQLVAKRICIKPECDGTGPKGPCGPKCP